MAEQEHGDYMSGLIIILAILNLVAGEWSVTGRRLAMSTHPVVVRMRWFTLGAVAVLFVVGHDFAGDDWLSWALAVALALAVARLPVESKISGGPGQPGAAPNGGPATPVDNSEVTQGPPSVSLDVGTQMEDRSTHYVSGEEIHAGDRILLAGAPGEIAFVIGRGESDADFEDSLDWFKNEYERGFMV